MEGDARSLNSTARLAGALYVAWIITGLYALFYVPSQIDTRGDAPTTARNVLSNELLFRAGILNDLVSAALWVVLILVLYRLFEHGDRYKARLMVALVLVQIPVLIVISAFNVASLMVFKGDVLDSFALHQRQDLAMAFLKFSDYGVVALEIFWGLWLLPLAILVYKSRFLPRVLGVWLIINGFALVVMSVTGLLAPPYHDALYRFGMLALLGEPALALWLLIKGAKLPAVTSAHG